MRISGLSMTNVKAIMKRGFVHILILIMIMSGVNFYYLITTHVKKNLSFLKII